MQIFLISIMVTLVLAVFSPRKETTYPNIEYKMIDLSAKSSVGTVDNTDPRAVVQAIFNSAKNRDFKSLSALCDPKGENDKRTELICELSESDRLLFTMEFENGKTLGKAVIKGNMAKVPYGYGLNGDDEETMELIKRDGKWYLYRFFSE